MPTSLIWHFVILDADHHRGDYSYYLEGQTTTLLQLASALVIELGLDTPFGRRTKGARGVLNDAWISLSQQKMVPPSEHTTDDKRSVLGCWYLTSMWVLSRCSYRDATTDWRLDSRRLRGNALSCPSLDTWPSVRISCSHSMSTRRTSIL